VATAPRARVLAIRLRRAGMDIAFGPDDPIFYVVFGSAWLRP
jgi:hypothetical protein